MLKLKIILALLASFSIIPVQSIFIGPIVAPSMTAPAADPPTTICTIPGPDFNLSASPGNVTITSTSSRATSTVMITSLHGFSGTLSLTNSTTNTGLNITLSKTSVTISKLIPGTTTLTITNSTVVAPGSYPVLVKAANATISHLVLVNVIVPKPGFSLVPASFFLTIMSGSTNFTTITITSLNRFANKVNLTASAPYTGFSASTSKSSVTLTSGGAVMFNVTISTMSFTAHGFYSVQVTGMSGSLSNSTFVEVHVIGPDFVVFATPTIVTLGPSGGAPSTVNLTRIMNFNGTVILTARVLGLSPSQPTATFASPTVTLSSTMKSATDQLTITTSSTPYNEYGILVNATSGTVKEYTAVTVIVSGLDLSSSESAITVNAGGASNTTTLTLQSIHGFSGNVALSGLCLPIGGLIASVSPSSAFLSTGGIATSTLTVSAPADSVPADYIVGVLGINRTISPTVSTVSNFTEVKVTVYGPDFRLTTATSTVAFAAGSSTTSTITVTSLGFTADVSFPSFILPSTALTVSSHTVSGAAGSATCTYTGS